MPYVARAFLYARVSTVEQTAENQIAEAKVAGFAIRPNRIITETISGSVAARQRPEFRRLLDRLEDGDVLVVTKLDWLGRSALDVRATVDALASLGVRLHCLALGGVDLTSSAGRMTMQVIAAVAELERDLLIERTQAGVQRARTNGKAIGRPASLTDEQKAAVREARGSGASVSSLARTYQVSRQTIGRVCE
ncbi:recombinase family protein [Acidiphilium multivorum]|uniref:recombinase family protein n=1 Tax=Acidiphilium multivorum TaxID=62140 RepID=UPI001B8B54DF|nr:recombinase family protein [Acidiphilium multivorum]MBS3024975.1 recombinase family protein [Acidiphilium multivorum]